MRLTPTPERAAPNKAAEADAPPELVLESGHTSGVFALAFSPDGRLLATASVDNSVKLWDVSTARGLRTLRGAASGITAFAFSADGRMLVAGDFEGRAHLWDVRTGERVRGWAAHQNKILTLAFSPDGLTVASGGADQAVKLWDARQPKEGRTLSGHAGWVTAVAFAPDGKTLISGGRDRVVKLWELSSGRERQSFDSHADAISALAFAPSAQTFASGDGTGAIRVWEVNRRAARFILPAQRATRVLALGFFAGGRELRAVRADSPSALMWDLSTGAALPPGGTASVPPADESGMGELQAAALNADGSRWAVSDGSNGDRAVLLRSTTVTAGAEQESYLSSRVSGIYANAFSPDGKWFASGSRDGAVHLWEAATGRELFSLSSDTLLVNSVAFSPDSRLVAAGCANGRIRLWDVAGGGVVTGELSGHAQGASVNAVAFNKSGVLASGGNDGTVRLWDAVALQEKRVLKSVGEVRALAFSPDGLRLAAGGTDRLVRVWEPGSGGEPRVLAGADGEIKSLAFSPDGRVLAVGTSANSIKLWRGPVTGDPATLSGHADWVTALGFTPDGKALVSGGRDGVINLWDFAAAVPTPRALTTRHAGRVNAISFLPERGLFTTSSEDGSTLLWDAATGERLASVVSLREGAGWLVATPDGLFDGAPTAWGQILWRFGRDTADVVPVEVFFNEFFYPGVFAELLAGRRPKAAQAIVRRDRRQPRVRVELAGAPPAVNDAAARDIPLRIEVVEAGGDERRPASSGAKDLRLFRNGLLVQVWRGEVIRGKEGRAVIETTVPVVAGENRLTAYVFNRDGVKSADATLLVEGPVGLARKGKVYLLAVGVNEYANSQYNLNFAVADARDFVAEVKRQQEDLGRYEGVEVISLQNREATKGNILGALGGLTTKVRPEDAVVVYFAGHGTAYRDRFYLLPHDLGYTGDRASFDQAAVETIVAHSISDRELELAFEKVDAGKLLFVVDACNSGQALEAEEKRRGPMNSQGLAQLAYEKGMYVLTASQSFQVANEEPLLGHGYLTYALLNEGLRGAADKEPADGTVLLREWFRYAEERVPRIHEEQMARRTEEDRKRRQGRKERELGLAAVEDVQRPRVFYRQELEAQPLIMARPGPAPSVK